MRSTTLDAYFMWQHLEVDMSVLGEEQRKRAALLWPTPLDRKVYAAALVEKVHIASMETMTSPVWKINGIEHMFLPGALAGAAWNDRIALPCASFNEQVRASHKLATNTCLLPTTSRYGCLL